MKTRFTFLFLIALTAATPALAKRNNVDELAAASGLTTREVQMVIGTRTAFAEYRTSFYRARKQLIEAIGPERYQEALRSRRPTEI